MNISDRDRFNATSHFERPGDLMLLTPDFNDFWPETLQSWARHDGPEQILNSRFRGDYLQFTHHRVLREIRTGFDSDRENDIGADALYVYAIPPIDPVYETRVIKHEEHTITVLNEGGQTVRVFKDNPQKMPTYLDHPVKDRASWEEYRKRLDPNSPGRLPADWDDYVQKMNSKTEPVRLNVGSFFGFLREWMGLERLLYMFHDDPVLVEDMMEQVCLLEEECLKRILKDLKVDFAFFWEDMCFKTGPLISPAMFKKFMVPRYKRVTDILHSHGIDSIWVDSDGNITELIPLWLEGGVNGFSPLEVAAGNDAVGLRKKYGRDVLLGGNMDKRAVIKGKAAIREEVMSKLPYLLEQGGYFPSVDHLVPPDTSWENYIYFINTMREVAGLEKLPSAA